MRWFAKTAGISSGAMSVILNRRHSWNLSWERALTVLQNIKLETEKINLFIALTSPTIIDDGQIFSIPSTAFPSQDAPVISVFFAFQLTSPPSLSHISQVTGLSASKIVEIAEGLVQKDLLERFEDTYRLSSTKGVQKYGWKEEAAGVIFSGSRATLAEVTKEVNSFYQRLYAIMNSSEQKDEVFHVQIRVQPLRFSSPASGSDL